MHKPSSKWGLGLLCLTVGGYSSLLVAACGGDDTAATTDTDAATDSTAPDTSVADTSTGTDANKADASKADASDAGTSADAADAADARDSASSCPGATDAASLDDAMVQAGKFAVQQLGCAGCHTGTFQGGTQLSTYVFSANITPDQDSGIGCWTDDTIARAILHGIDPSGATICSPMPVFANRNQFDAGAGGEAGVGIFAEAGADLTARQIVQYLRSMTPVHNVVTESQCLADGGTLPPDAGPADAADGG